ncbi:LIC10486 family protein [Leptospira haakeii]|uniref:Flagellar motor switch protein FliG C-terminal domain-containing protein n=1 Tax=Leptospira haakeii TaxID=2023198 RepID=A0ABX4PRP3_9LEPT|nr:hypothetical protein [Leptospira haakeii]PKA17377.1 hypothetical protein CH363_01640 [Leptospira haakeii]PKA21101.1 hypothetical protein CH377_01640 [Leptospira haakeii]
MEQNPQTSKLQEQANQMNLALESVHTEEQAIELIQGKIKDAYLLKLRIDVENKAGVVLGLLSRYKNEFLELYSLFSNSSVIRKIRTFEDFGQISHDIAEAARQEAPDPGLSDAIGRILHTKLTKQILEQYYPMWDRNDTAALVNMLENQIKTTMKINMIRVQADVEYVSSLKCRGKSFFAGIIQSIPKPPEEPAEGAGAPVENLDPEKAAVMRQIETIRKGFGRVVLAKTILSPVNGIDFDDLNEGDKILLQLPSVSPEEKALAKTLGAMDKDGNVKPVVGSFVAIASGKNEYHIFAKGPAGVLLQAFEERPVRLARPKTAANAPRPAGMGAKQSEGNNTLNYAILVGVVLLVGLLAFILLK